METATEVEEPVIDTAEDDVVGVVSPVNFPSVTKLLESTGIVIIVIVVLVFVLRKKIGTGTSIRKRKRFLSIIDTASLGSKRNIHLIKIPGKLLLIGATNDQIRPLASITEKEIVESVDKEKKSNDFLSIFKRVDVEQK
ncbi:MAG: flagellar biosynthetic protein FliO [Candidatus Brocadiaceae bacterium]|nr:flagellar biosynthetic protein FliO [Candidatus Brocadiaceae bacterium]